MKIFIETYGCQSNESSSEAVAGLLSEAGYRIVPQDAADLIILNTCALQTPTENKILRRLSELNLSRKKALVIGCLTEVMKDKIEDVAPQASIASVSSVGHIVEIVKKIESGTRVMRFRDKPASILGTPKLRVNPVVAIIPIADGCLENCTFCIDRLTRGTLVSGEPDRILREAEAAISHGAKEIHLVAQDVAAYGIDTGMRLPALLRKLALLSGDYKIKLGAMNPANVLPILNDLVLALNHPKMYRFIDLPLQSGSNKILSEMKRGYTLEQYRNIISEFRKRYSNIAISTDVLIGFPGETDEDFGKTVGAINDIKPDAINIYQYSTRPLTKAASMGDVIPSWKIKNRADEIKGLALKYADMANEQWLGWHGDVTVTEFENGAPIGRNFAYKPVIVPNQRGKLGESIRTEIVKARSDYLVGK